MLFWNNFEFHNLRIVLLFFLLISLVRVHFEETRENKKYIIRGYINFVKVEQHSISIVGQMTG